MADILTNNWSEVASDNQQPPPDGWPEGMARSAVNNAAREMMAAVKRFINRSFPTRASVATGVNPGQQATAYQVDYTVPPAAYTQGMTFAFRADRANAAGVTLRINTLPTKTLKKASVQGLVPLAAGDIVAGQVVVCVYDSLADAFLVTSLLAPAAAGQPAVGDVKWSMADNAGPGWLPCDGRALSRTTYAALFAAIGTKFGPGDGSTTFNLPNAMGRVLACSELLPGATPPNPTILGQNQPVGVGFVTGAAKHTLTLAEMPQHSHTGTTDTQGNHQHTGTTVGVGDHVHTGWTDAQGHHVHGAWTDVQGAHAHNVPDIVVVGAYGLAGGANVSAGFGTRVTDTQGAHGHNVGMDGAGNHAHNVGTHGAGAHSHDFTTGFAGAHSHSLAIGATGGFQPHNNLQPLIVANLFIYTGVLA